MGTLFMKAMDKIVEVNFQYDFMIKYYLLDVCFHIMILRIELLEQEEEIMHPHIQTT